MAEIRSEEGFYRVGGQRPFAARSLADILSDLLGQFTTLIKQEGELARTEISENIRRLVMGIAMAAGAAVLLLPALVILLLAAVYGLETTGLAPWWSALAIGGGAFLLGLLILAIGLGRLRANSLMPNKTISQLQEDAAMAKRQVRKVETETRSGDGYERAA